MVNDREILKQMLERDVINIYRQLPNLLGPSASSITSYMSLFENKILNYADIGIGYVTNWLFGADGDIDEAADIAKMMANDKIEEYRRRVKESRKNS